MSALTSSIAHELGQPLSSMIHNAQALQTMVIANRATAGTIAEILSDIREPGRPGDTNHRSPSDHAPKSQAGQETDRPSRRDIMKALLSSLTTWSAADQGNRQSVVESLRHQRRSGALAAGAREPGDERHGRDGRDAAGPTSRHDPHRSQGGGCRGFGARHRNRFAGADQRHAVHPILHDEIARPRDRPDDRARRSSRLMVAASMPATILKGARHSRSRCPAAKRPRIRATARRLPSTLTVVVAQATSRAGCGRPP